ncbi:STAS domain-containing protein [Algirhabdus cladophorae]|uniref:STAS domain-containing protein n=1 Tax=Algirhabdus cladophorae TaxID=3377108 RepID=UPI003B84B6DF
MSDASIYPLGRHKGHPAQNPLIAFFQNVQDRDVDIQCDNVSRMDAQNLQILLSAQKVWQAKGLNFELSRMSNDLRSSLALLGVSSTQFENEVPS